MPTSKYAARARLSALHRHRGPDDPAVAAARSVLREAKLFEEIAREAEADPPLSTEARARLAVLLERERWGDLLTYGAEPEECTRIVLAERAAKFALEVEGQAHRLRVREAAQRKIRTEQRRDVGNLDPIPLDRFLAIPDEPVDYRIAGLWPKGGRIVLAAQWKVGKTTLTGNVIRALADGALFLDRFQTQPAEVTLLDFETDPRKIRQWLRDQRIKYTPHVHVIALRGRVSSFDILDAEVRSEWAARLRGSDVAIFDFFARSLTRSG